MHSRKIASFIDRTPNLARLGKLAAALRELQKTWNDSLPDELKGLSEAVGGEGGTLMVATRSSAVAAKLRQMETRLLINLAKNGLEVSAIKVRMQVELLPHQAKNPKRNLELGESALNAFSSASEQLPDSPLKQAMHTLLAKRRQS